MDERNELMNFAEEEYCEDCLETAELTMGVEDTKNTNIVKVDVEKVFFCCVCGERVTDDEMSFCIKHREQTKALINSNRGLEC
jgi:hypothetical protein